MAILTINRGLVTSPNELTKPDGAAEVLDNCVIDFDNTVQSRRGFGEFGSKIDDDSVAKQLMTYKGRIIRHFSNKLSFDSDGNGTFLNFSGSYTELINRLRIKYFELNSNLYFTTSEGIKKISATNADEFSTDANYITNAGGVKAVSIEAKLAPDLSGFLPAQSKVAYKILWAKKDVNGNVIRGVPSSRFVITNTSQDINVGESFSVEVLSHALITNSSYFLFDTPISKFAIWFNVSGSATAPTSTELVGRTLKEVKLSGLTPISDTATAAKIAEVLYEITDIEVLAETTKVTVTNRDGGDVLDASQGNVSSSAVKISTVINGQTATGTPANVELTIPVPTQIVTANDKLYFFEVYRTAIITASIGAGLDVIDPGEEFQKIYEAGVEVDGSNQVVAEIIHIDDVPEAFREGGAYLYTNPVTGESVLQANETPPIAHDVAVFKGSAFYANTKERHRTQFNLLAVNQLISGTSKLYIGNSSVLREYTFIGQNKIIQFTAKKKSETNAGTYFDIKTAQNRVTYRVWFDKGGSTPPSTNGSILLRVSLEQYEESTATVQNSVDAFINAFFDVPDFLIQNISHEFNSLDNVNSSTETISIINHGFENGDVVTFSGTSPTGITNGLTYYIVNKTSNDFQVSTSIGGSPLDITAIAGTSKITQSTIKLIYADNGDADDVAESATDTGWDLPTLVQEGLGEDASQNEVLLSGLASQGLSVEDTARSLERVINKDPDSPVNAFYLSGLNDLPGILLLETKSLTDDPFYLGFSHSTTTSIFEPAIPVVKQIDDVNSPGVIITSTPHELTIGQQVYTFIKPTLTAVILSGKQVVSSTPAVNTFTISGFSTTNSYTSFDQAVIFPADVVSDNSVNPNRVYFSKIGQPEAVPLVNYIDIGPRDKAIQRILALRDSLIVLKEDGVYVISGSAAPNFSVRLSDSSALTYAPDTATNLNNLIYVLTSQGVVTVSETGVGVISRNIENKIQEIANAKYDYKYMSWGMSSESDRCYLLWLPTKIADVYSTQAFRYNTFTRTWTRWTKPANCGVVNIADDKIYLGDSSGRPYVLKERKNFERQDYADREIVRGLGANAINGLTYTISSVAELEAGDVLVQKQYIDINKFNRTLKKLDRDSWLNSSNNYYSTRKAITGDNLADKLLQLATKLQNDGISVPTPSNSNNVDNLRADFNNIVNFLNSPLSPNSFKNYKLANDALYYETLVTSVVLRNNTITVNQANKFIQGDVSFFKGINCIVQYAPQHFGKPESTKQIPDGTFIFDQNNFWGGTIAYATDRSYDFSSITFSGKGPGYWDGYNWANVTFGGEGNEVPVRTLIPRDKSRCRYIHVQFTHINAREEWKLVGVSLEPREVSTRGYR